VSISSLSVTNNVATAISTAANGFQVGQMVTISGASNSVYDGTFVITGLANTSAGIASEIGAATEFTFNLVTANGTASGTITATLDDQFNYAYEPITGSASISAKLVSLTNADNGSGTPQAGVMFRASTNPDDPFFEVVQTSASTVVLEYRTSTGGGVTTQTVSGIPVGSEYVEILRNGSNFGGYYSSNGTSWTQIGSTVAISAMPSTANVGLAATATYNPQLTDATFTNVTVNTGPTVTNAAAANPNPVTATSTALSALGSENGSGSGLTYTWSCTGPSGVTYSGNTNGTNAAQNITANFTQAGSYNFTVTIADANGLYATSGVAVVVQQTATTIAVSPSNTPVVPVGLSQQFSATANDQFGNAISSPSFSWGIGGSGNSISSAGDATLGSTPGTFTVTASIGSAQGMANVIAENFAVPAGSTLDVNLGAAGPVAISASGSNITASQSGVQITLSEFSAVSVTDTASGDVVNFNGPLAEPLTFANCGTSTVNVNSGTMSFAGAATISLGTLNVAAGASAVMPLATGSQSQLILGALSVGAGSTLDLSDNTMILSYAAGSDPITTIAGYLNTGYNGGNWTGLGGIITSAPLSNGGLQYGLGFADGADGKVTGLSSGQIEVKYTLLGDANLDGLVNGSDLALLAANFNQPVTGWDQGDFNYGTVVNGSDLALLAANFNQAVSLPAAVEAAPVAAPIVLSTAATTKTSAAGKSKIAAKTNAKTQTLIMTTAPAVAVRTIPMTTLTTPKTAAAVTAVAQSALAQQTTATTTSSALDDESGDIIAAIVNHNAKKRATLFARF
jgi:hypothetical protein